MAGITTGPRLKSPEDWARKQIERSVAAASDWEKGIQNPKRDPIQAAIAANEKRKVNLAKAEKEERWLKAMKKVDSSEMIATALRVGGAGYAAGILAREGKIANKIGVLHKYLSVHVAEMDKMPTDTDIQREAKMIANLRGMRLIKDKIRA